MNKPEYLTTKQFSEAIGVSLSTVQKWDKKGILKPYMKTPGGKRFYTKQQVEDYNNQYTEKQ